MSSNNPLGSTSVSDMFLNAGNLDKALNGNQDTWIDRFGVERVSWNYIEKVTKTGELSKQAREALRRSYAEAGLNMVDGSFEKGGILVNTNDVLLHEATGKCYSGNAGTVAPGTLPTSGGFVDKSAWFLKNGSLDASFFGVDVSGITASDDQLLDALNFSAANSLEIVVTGKCRLTRTMLQPVNSIIRCDGIIFCENPEGLTNSLLWDVGGVDIKSKTEIRSINLSTSPSTSAYVDRLMKPIRITLPRTKVGIIRTYGFQLGGPEVGPTGYEINIEESTSILNTWDPLYKDAYGFSLTTTDCTIGKIITALYPAGPRLGSTNHIKSVHCWGLPATATNEYPNKQLLTGPTVGTATVVDYMYIDSLDTSSYNTPASLNEGVGIIVSGYENSIVNLVYRYHPQTKPGKIKLGRFTGFSNSIDCLQVPGGSGFDLTAPFIYDNEITKWRNRINKTNVPIVNTFRYTTEFPPSGFTNFTGTMVINKVGSDVNIKLFFDATTVDNTPTSDFIVNLPTGLTIQQGVLGLVAQRTCLGMSSTDNTLTQDFAYSDNESKIKIAYRKRDTGQMFFLKQSGLRPGMIELNIRAMVTGQM